MAFGAKEVISTTPINTEKSVRGDEIRALTSCKAGKIIPLAYVPLLREDRVSRGKVRCSLKMSETIHPLMNSINVTVYAHFIPFLAFERFSGMESFNRSYQGIGEPHNNTPIPFFETHTYNRESPFYKTMGIHYVQGQPINSALLEAYNVLVNFRRKARSEKLPGRGKLQDTLARAFWKNSTMWHIVPDFDQAMMDGEVPLEFDSMKLPITGIAVTNGAATAVTTSGKEVGGSVETYAQSWRVGEGQATGVGGGNILAVEVAAGAPAIYAELASAGIKLSLANIEVAKRTAAFAKLRQRYQAVDDDYIIDLLMEGIRVPDEALKQPILLAKQSTIFGYSERHAMDGASLDMSVTTGETSLDISFRTPAMNTGGIILFTAEIVPEQLFERQVDTLLGLSDPAALPNFMRDFLDPEKVQPVGNRYVDILHSNPGGIFGYAPLNHAWKRSLTRIGGKYFRPTTNTFVEDRQRFWAVEQINPALNTDFYLVPQELPHTVFMDTISDPFEVMTVGKCEIVGNTVFGKALEEDNDDYEKVMAQVPMDRIVQG